MSALSLLRVSRDESAMGRFGRALSIGTVGRDVEEARWMLNYARSRKAEFALDRRTLDEMTADELLRLHDDAIDLLEDQDQAAGEDGDNG
jgi:hypothetical protein